MCLMCNERVLETSECRAYNALVHHQTIISAKLLVGQCQVCNATAVTPNIPESEALSGRKIASRADVREVARRLSETYGCAVLVKGGHAVGDLASAEDTLFDGKDFFAFAMPWVEDPVSTHGTGCSLAAALTAELTLARPLPTAVKGAKAYVHAAIENSFLVGKNCGVLGFAG